MSRTRVPLIALAALLLLALVAPAAAGPVRQTAPAADLVDQLIVGLRPGGDLAAQSQAQPDQVAAQLSAETGLSLSYAAAGPAPDLHVLQLPRAMTTAEAAQLAAQVATSPSVAYAEPNVRLYPALIPSDPRYAAEMWHLQPVNPVGTSNPANNYGVNMPPAWDITTGNSNLVVAVIDTGGLLNHEDLAGRTPAGNSGYDFVSDPFVGNDDDGRDPDPSDPGDWVEISDGCGVPTDSSWHGSHVAGTIGASANNGKGVVGVNWASRLLHLRGLGKCGGTLNDIAAAVRWAAGLSVSGVPDNPNPARVINMSLGGGGSCSITMQDAINAAVATGAVVVVAAGNSDQNVSNFQPGNCNNVITVAATDQDGYKASYSNFGSLVELSAPGGDSPLYDTGVLSTVSNGTTSPTTDGYAAYNGTSMASPHVAGIVSLMLSVNPGLSNTEVLDILQDTVTPFPGYSDCSTSTCGAGIVNAGNAVEEAARRVRTLALGSAAQTVSETTGTVSIPLSLSVVSNQNISVPYTVSGTAGGSDHDLTNGTLTIPAGATSANISFNLVNDSVTEPAETIIVTLGTPGGTPPRATLTGPTTHTVTVIDSGTSLLNIGTASVSENGSNYEVAFTVTRQGGLSSTASVSYTIEADLATDVELLAGTVNFAASETSKSVTATIAKSEVGTAPALIVSLSSPSSSAVLGSNTSARLVIDLDQFFLFLPIIRR